MSPEQINAWQDQAQLLKVKWENVFSHNEGIDASDLKWSLSDSILNDICSGFLS
jgi:hypothetical protein